MGELPSLWPGGQRQPQEVLRIAHRGRVGAPAPYSAVSLAHVAGEGAHLLEFDIQVTDGDRPVVGHDAGVVEGDIVQVVDAARTNGLGLYADLKSLTPGAARFLVGLLQDREMADRTILASGDGGIVRLCAEVAPTLPRAILFWDPNADAVALAHSTRAHFVHPCWEWLQEPHLQLVERDWLGKVRAERLGVICWHEERRRVVEGLWRLGVDGVCTDDPPLLTRVAAG